MANIHRIQILVNRLRSGGDVQGDGCLRRPQGDGTVEYCCLGVATEIYRGWEGKCVPEDLGYRYEYTRYDGALDNTIEQSSLFLGVQEWYGFDRDDPGLWVPVASIDEASILDWDERKTVGGVEYVRVNATDCNDTYEMTFPEIGDAFYRTFIDPAFQESE